MRDLLYSVPFGITSHRSPQSIVCRLWSVSRCKDIKSFTIIQLFLQKNAKKITFSLKITFFPPFSVRSGDYVCIASLSSLFLSGHIYINLLLINSFWACKDTTFFWYMQILVLFCWKNGHISVNTMFFSTNHPVFCRWYPPVRSSPCTQDGCRYSFHDRHIANM